MGGGFDCRPYISNGAKVSATALNQAYFDSQRTSVLVDNTYAQPIGVRGGSPLRGEYAVSPLFDGDFDYTAKTGLWDFATSAWQSIPGWSGINQNQLKLWSDAGATNDLAAGYANNYALELLSGQSITHNAFVVPDWGALRFDLFAPNLKDGRVVVTLDAGNGNAFSTFVNLTPAVGSATEYLADTQRIGYGSTGFETFTFDVPDRFRGKTATLRFDSSGPTIYLDNVFFKSQHLAIGNPTRNDQLALPKVTQLNNFLLEKPQYAVSYNAGDKIPNWVSWQLNNSWTGDSQRIGRNDVTSDYPYGSYYPWMPDVTLPSGTPTAIPTDYAVLQEIDRGHLAPVNDRDRSTKDQISTFLLTNVLPQYFATNESFAWKRLEDFSSKIVQEKGWELYIIAGGNDRLLNDPTVSDPLKESTGINTPDLFWKVIVVTKPGQTIADITADTTVIAVIIPNYPVEPDLSNPDMPDPRRWIFNTTSVNEIERLTGLDLLSNLPDDVEYALQRKVYNGTDLASAFPNAASILSPLLAGVGSDETDDPSSIWQNSILEGRTLQPGVVNTSRNFDPSLTQINISQIGLSQIELITDNGASEGGTTEVGFGQAARFKNGVAEISPSQISSAHNSIRYAGMAEVSMAEIGFFQPSTSQISMAQIGTTQISSTQTSSTKHTSTQVDPTQFSIFQINSAQSSSTEISFPSSITLQQLLSSHNPNLQNTTVPTWLEFLQGTTPFNLNIEITDLPTGQLAEANIIGYDPTGRPNAGTLYLDTDANGLGWYIDPTPWNNSEFAQSLTDTAYRATADSAAYGHYDLLTTILHETSHLQGFIAGYSGFDSHIQTVNGTKVFISDGFSAILTPDGSHLDSSVYAYDVMNTTLTPGVRKLPSALVFSSLHSNYPKLPCHNQENHRRQYRQSNYR